MKCTLWLGCNPCYNGNDLQDGRRRCIKSGCCNPCYNGNDLQDILDDNDAFEL